MLYPEATLEESRAMKGRLGAIAFAVLRGLKEGGASADELATTEALMSANIPANLPIGESVTLQGTIYDQAWNAQSLNYTWTKTGANAWTVDFAVGGGTVDPALTGTTV